MYLQDVGDDGTLPDKPLGTVLGISRLKEKLRIDAINFNNTYLLTKLRLRTNLFRKI